MTSERDQLYRKLDSCLEERRYQALKIAALRRELVAVRTANTAKEAKVMRREAQQYRKALSNIQHRLDNGGVDETDLRSIVSKALLLRGIRPWHRDEIKKHGGAA